MSIGVDLKTSGNRSRPAGRTPLLTVTDEGRPTPCRSRPDWQGDELIVRPGPRTTGNAERSPEVSLLWPVSGRTAMHCLSMDWPRSGWMETRRLSW